jgi:hypothetical protein
MTDTPDRRTMLVECLEHRKGILADFDEMLAQDVGIWRTDEAARTELREMRKREFESIEKLKAALDVIDGPRQTH